MEFKAFIESCIYENLGNGKMKMSICFECEPTEEQLKEILYSFYKQGKDFKLETTSDRFEDELRICYVGGQFFPDKSRLRIKLI